MSGRHKTYKVELTETEKKLVKTAADQFFAATLCIHIGGVDEVAARINVGVKDGFGDLVGCTPARCAEGHRAKGKRADNQAGATEGTKGSEAHGFLF
ncbi:hypothetical protein AVDCRST_MAG81-349 [uncultured Synechococcales cyanobacterium]|uniref:Uncharacterized protein n=1 Tax=uncultured Synechococcales cyanobacterium TaxID=1936017 RepID=A0A6J4UV58_9CYAN|nr:hypothetical protein AVDCRST_MAG81-349 [uncultured Synechococcales cyanobacterium]